MEVNENLAYVKKEQFDKVEATTQVVLESLELDFDFSVTNDKVMDILRAVAHRKGTVQGVLAQAPC